MNTSSSGAAFAALVALIALSPTVSSLASESGSNRDRIREDFGIEVLDANLLQEDTQLEALYAVLAAFPPGTLPDNVCRDERPCLNSIRVRDLLLDTDAAGYSPYKLWTLDLIDQWWRTIMVPQGFRGPNIFYDFWTVRDYMVRDEVEASSKSFVAVAFHELMHNIDSSLYAQSSRYQAWRETIVERLGTDPDNYIRSDVLEKNDDGYFQDHPNELVASLMNAWQQDSSAVLRFCVDQEGEHNEMLIVSQCLGMLDVLAIPEYGAGIQARGVATDQNATVQPFLIDVSRDPTTAAVDGFIVDGTWHRYALDEFGIATTALDLRCGDTNGDGYSLQDYLYIAQASKGLVSCTLEICDVDRNGLIARRDAKLVRRAIKSRKPLACE